MKNYLEIKRYSNSLSISSSGDIEMTRRRAVRYPHTEGLNRNHEINYFVTALAERVTNNEHTANTLYEYVVRNGRNVATVIRRVQLYGITPIPAASVVSCFFNIIINLPILAIKYLSISSSIDHSNKVGAIIWLETTTIVILCERTLSFLIELRNHQRFNMREKSNTLSYLFRESIQNFVKPQEAQKIISSQQLIFQEHARAKI